MPGKDCYQVVRNFKAAIQQAISCVVGGALSLSENPYSPSLPGALPHLLMLNNGDAVRLQHDSRAIALAITFHYRLVEDPKQLGSWKVATAGYYFWIEDGDGRDIIAYHWHPEGQGEVTYPHIHIGAGSGVDPRGPITTKTHIPTGRVAVEDVLRLVIGQMGARPRQRDWEQRLAKSQRVFETAQTWAQSSGKPQ